MYKKLFMTNAANTLLIFIVSFTENLFPKPMPKKEKPVDDLEKLLRPLVKKVKQLQDEAKVLGIFANHRDLAECLNCKLVEDVTCHGRLIVFRGDNYYEDTGLRFIELKDNAVQCPECSTIFCPYIASMCCKK